MNAWAMRWRFATSPLRRLPDFIIPGEAKCGTTSLYHHLTQHPRVHRADVKEPNNFLDYGGSPLLCRMHYPWRGTGGLTGEASAEYFSKPQVPATIAALLPAARIIILLRNPITRAFSDHQMFFKDGREPMPFDETVRRSIAWLSDPTLASLVDAAGRPNHNPVRYVGRGIYLPALKRWQAVFAAHPPLVLKSEDLFDDPQRVADEVFSFLGLSEHPLADVAPRKRGDYRSPLAADTIRALRDFYRPHNEALYAHLGRDLGWEAEADRMLEAAS